MQKTFCIVAACFLLIFSAACGKKDSTKPAIAAENNLPPLASPGDAPEFVRNLSLLYPQAELYRVDNKVIQKTNHPLGDVTRFFADTLRKHGFSETTHLEQSGGALLQYERTSKTAKDTKELVSVDISKLPYAENLLIRIGRSEVDYSRGKTE